MKTKSLCFNCNFDIRRGEYDYIVTLGNDVYEMSSNANMPNGVCIYIGESKIGKMFRHLPPVTFHNAPEGLKMKVRQLYEEM